MHAEDKIWKLKQQYGHITNIYVDAANPEVWQALKREFSERYDDHYIRETIAYAKKSNLHIEDQMFIVPVPFSTEGTKMLQHVKWLLEEREEADSSLIAIYPSFD